MPRRGELAAISTVAQLLALIVVVAALYFARDVFVPLALGLLLSFLLSPLVNRIQRLGVSNLIAVLTVAALAVCCVTGTLVLLGRELTTLALEMPQYREELISKARSVAGLRSGMSESLDELAADVTEALGDARAASKENGDKPTQSSRDGKYETTVLIEAQSQSADPNVSSIRQWTDSFLSRVEGQSNERVHDGKTAITPLYITQVEEGIPLGYWVQRAGSILGPLGTAGLIIVFTLFMLVHRDNLRDRMIAVVAHGNYVTTAEALNEVAKRISGYLIAQTIVNVLFGFVLALGLSIIGWSLADNGVFPNAFLWGVLATLLRFVPYAGPIVSALFPLSISLLVFPGYTIFLSVLALIVTMELLSNNVLEPWFYGTSSGISSVAVIIAAVFWGWLWGPIGLLLSTPLTVCLVVLGRHVPRFKIFATLLGENVEINPSLRFYQRLLANDTYQAKDLLAHYSGQQNLIGASDEVLIPALKRMRADRHSEELTAVDSAALLEVLKAIVMEIQWLEPAAATTQAPDNRPATPSWTPRPYILGCPAHHVSEHLTLQMLGFACAHTCDFETLDESILPSTVAKTVSDRKPAAVVIAVLPPGGFAQASYLCHAIREGGYRGVIIVAAFGRFKHLDRLFVRLRKAGATSLTTTFRQTCSKLLLTVERTQSRPPIEAEPHLHSMTYDTSKTLM